MHILRRKSKNSRTPGKEILAMLHPDETRKPKNRETRVQRYARPVALYILFLLSIAIGSYLATFAPLDF